MQSRIMNHNPRAIKQQSLSQMVADELRKRIWIGELNYGERLLETELSTELDVSRSSLREAFQTLEYEGLIINKARKGTFVYNFTKEDMEEINELRNLIEVPALRKTVHHMTAQDFSYLDDILASMKEEIEAENWYELFNLDMEFHLFLVNQCGNTRIVKTYGIIQMQIRTFLSQLESFYSENKSMFTKEHEILVDALKAQDEDHVARLAEAHIKQIGSHF
ncbi:GntR family transcriptional regulator [Salibacterium aidingense]|uniref:GntR family transcriptional regulator n=1 Tax=Salibacterium aidingense TaxID=384933 RepID=UPI003BD12CEC